jgi:hypothetical protein
MLEEVDALSYTDACLKATGGATTYATPGRGKFLELWQ